MQFSYLLYMHSAAILLHFFMHTHAFPLPNQQDRLLAQFCRTLQIQEFCLHCQCVSKLPTGSDYLGELEADEPLEGAPQLEKLVPIKVLNFDGDGAQMVLLRSLLLKAPGLAKLLLISRRRGELQEPQVLDDLTTVQIVLRKDDDTDTEPVHSREAEF